MPYRPTRRDLLASAAALVAAPLVTARAAADYDVAIVGAGAAGLSAARKIAAVGRRCIVLEASASAGGRIASAVSASGVKYERGASRFSAPKRNPLVALARSERLHVYDPPAGKRLYVGEREARDNEYDDFTASLGRTSRTIAAVAELGRDIPASLALPSLGDWQGTVAFALGPLGCGKELADVSTVDLSRAEDRYDDVMLREGTAALIAAAAKSLQIELNTIVEEINSGGRGRVEIATNKGAFGARVVIVTASTGALASGRIRFSPSLPQPLIGAMAKLSPGTAERAIFALPGNPFRFNSDERVIFKTGDTRSLMFTMRPGGSDLVYADFGGNFGREISAAGDGAIKDFIAQQISGHFSGGTKTDIGKVEVVRWSKQPFVLGGISVAAPGAGGSRSVLMQPVNERVFFAGEAAHETLWGTIAGAALSGERAAALALRHLGAEDRPEPAKPAAPERRRRR